MSKPEGLYSIGEIATVCGVSINTLRFYESKSLIKPACTALESGYRYYNRENLHRLRTILGLKEAGLSLPEIKEYLDGSLNKGVKIAAFEKRRAMLDLAIEDLKIRNTQSGDLFVYELILPPRLCLCRTIEAKDGEHAVCAIGEFYDESIRKGVSISHAWTEFCEYSDDGLLKGEFKMTDFTFTACLPVDSKNAPPEAVLYPSGDAVAVNYKGSYFKLWRAYEALGHYIEEHGYTPAGYPQEIYLEIEPDGSVQLDNAHNITRVIIPIRRKA